MSNRKDVLAVLRENARQSNADIARQTGLTEPEVERIVDELESEGVVKGYTAIVDWEAVEEGDEPVRATVELNVTLDRETSYIDIAERIAKFPQVKSLRLISGDYDFDMEVEGDSMSEVSHFVSDKIAPIPEITQTVTHYIMESYKEQGVEFGDGNDDDRLSISP
ncbi:Lrp/AsnC family transcriptional regulator [Halomicrobium sp. IBSBa]|uniref:Lrp/AsnC family transcriptional regulator n=1 Tax=Halomicrobium sp. IBSBa TaxID=2778916 RepID=UPI001ABFBE91|nr:Lrp/AsnC family transcriptional regulator [Halomicrobium sp. IBSBa]MBO4248157.1 Lrp/AsnC family transcriptional regulator [Halomicrobium sp. IBSBa]